MEKSKFYLTKMDVGQACEEAFHAVEMALTDYVTDLEAETGVKIVPSRDRWSRAMMDKLVSLLSKNFVNDEDKRSFLAEWSVAKV